MARYSLALHRSKLKAETRTAQKAANSHEKHEKSQEDEWFTFEQVCRTFRAFLRLFVAIPGTAFTV